MTDSQQPEQKTRQWLEDAVIGLSLCPFARPVYTNDQVRIAVEESAEFDEVIQRTLAEVDRLLEADPDDIATTLIVCPNALADFDEFLDAAEIVQTLLTDAGADGVLQLAHFHPDYQFAGTEPDAPENFTNRAPYPTLHLLREAQVTEAVDSHPDPESIPQTNIDKLEKMGRERLDELWSKWSE